MDFYQLYFQKHKKRNLKIIFIIPHFLAKQRTSVVKLQPKNYKNYPKVRLIN